mmetsp:Transcript_8473/g.24029  ORF Transcript_8473/g.24029 Transcript_8473/m.24029 type:complete len:263 (+) Transcript_8473:2385-3173(+)
MGVLEAHTDNDFLIPVEATADLVVLRVAVESDRHVGGALYFPVDLAVQCQVESEPLDGALHQRERDRRVTALRGLLPLDAAAHGAVEGVFAAQAQDYARRPGDFPVLDVALAVQVRVEALVAVEPDRPDQLARPGIVLVQLERRVEQLRPVVGQRRRQLEVVRGVTTPLHRSRGRGVDDLVARDPHDERRGAAQTRVGVAVERHVRVESLFVALRDREFHLEVMIRLVPPLGPTVKAAVDELLAVDPHLERRRATNPLIQPR